MRNKIFGGIGILWGGGILLRWILADSSGGSDAYQSGNSLAVLFGLLLFVVGIYYFIKKTP